LAWTASGRFDGIWERNLGPWDMAAGIVLVREAGGMTSDLHGNDAMLEHGSIVAANSDIKKSLLAILTDATGR